MSHTRDCGGGKTENKTKKGCVWLVRELGVEWAGMENKVLSSV